MAYFSVKLEDAKMKLSHNVGMDLLTVVSFFDIDISSPFEIIAFFAKADFCQFFHTILRTAQESLNIFTITL